MAQQLFKKTEKPISNSPVFPLGKDSFSKLRKENCYYIDKTNLIEDLVSQRFEVTLITRPRRFGKTLAMSMLEDFFDIGRDSKQDFKGLAICENKGLCAEWMNKWPVLFLTLKDVEGSTFDGAYGMLTALIADLCKKYSFLADSERINAEDRNIFRALMARKADIIEIKNCIHTLTRMMNAYYGKPVILLIDEYDVPLAKASDFGYYDDMLDVVRALFSKALKSNEHLKLAVITGCLRIAKESIFTGTNNFVSDTISNNRLNEHIGFTEADLQKLLSDTGFQNHAAEIKSWYDGYRFGTVHIYCPWDVLNHVSALQRDENSRPESYWENTSDNGIIRKFIDRKDLWTEEQINEDFETLLEGGFIVKSITENLTYDMLHSSADNLWSLLYLTGYLTQVPEAIGTGTKAGKVALKIPNAEIRLLFLSTIVAWFEDKVKATDRTDLFRALWDQDETTCSAILSKFIFDTISYHDYREDFYHAFMVGILSFAGYKLKSSDEEGEGRPDIVLRDERNGRAIVMEIKRAATFKEMDAKCDEALMQIGEKRYMESLETEYEEVLGYGICFYRKRCLVKAKKGEVKKCK